jgi:hypothetical protein
MARQSIETTGVPRSRHTRANSFSRADFPMPVMPYAKHTRGPSPTRARSSAPSSRDRPTIGEPPGSASIGSTVTGGEVCVATSPRVLLGGPSSTPNRVTVIPAKPGVDPTSAKSSEERYSSVA